MSAALLSDPATDASHKNAFQRAAYPKGRRVEVLGTFDAYTPDGGLVAVPVGTRGSVMDHCDDGRAVFELEPHRQRASSTHTFQSDEDFPASILRLLPVGTTDVMGQIYMADSGALVVMEFRRSAFSPRIFVRTKEEPDWNFKWEDDDAMKRELDTLHARLEPGVISPGHVINGCGQELHGDARVLLAEDDRHEYGDTRFVDLRTFVQQHPYKFLKEGFAAGFYSYGGLRAERTRTDKGKFRFTEYEVVQINGWEKPAGQQ